MKLLGWLVLATGACSPWLTPVPPEWEPIPPERIDALDAPEPLVAETPPVARAQPAPPSTAPPAVAAEPPPEGAAEPAPEPPPECYLGADPGPVPSGRDICEATLSADGFAPSFGGCYIDERITKAPGKLFYRCGGGEAHAVFGKHHFAGEVRGGKLALCVGTTFRFVDGCMWQSAQQIYGELASGKLAFRYSEHEAPGQGACASPCTATSGLSVR